MHKFLALIAVFFVAMGCVQQQTTATPTPVTTPSPAPTVAASATPAELRAQAEDVVSVEYVGRLENGTVFDTNVKAEALKAGLPERPAYPLLSFTVGAGEMIAGFDKAVVGMKVGEKKAVTIPAAEAYGERSERNEIAVPIEDISVEGGVKVGMRLSASNGVSGVVTAVNDTHATLDFNHPLAGKALVFDITMKDIKRP